MNQPEVPRYVTLFYDTRKQLDINWTEYILLEMILRLSYRTGYCFKSPAQMANDLGITKRGVNKMITRLIEKGYLFRLNDESLQVKKVYYDLQMSGNKVPTSHNSGNSVPGGGNSTTQSGNSVPE